VPSAAARALIDKVGTADDNDLDLVANELDKFPPEILQRLQAQGTRIKVCRGSVTEYRTDLRGVQPRGWPPGSTWDTVPGVGGTNEVTVATIGHPGNPHVPVTGEGHGEYNLVLHEVGHGIDLGGGNLSTGAAFNTARTADAATLNSYESQAGVAGQQETYATSIAGYYGGDPNFAANHPNLNRYWASNPLNPTPAPARP
jgi:hypothetical protein